MADIWDCRAGLPAKAPLIRLAAFKLRVYMTMILVGFYTKIRLVLLLLTLAEMAAISKINYVDRPTWTLKK